MYDQDLIWSRYSEDKTDIGIELMQVARSMHKALPLEKKLRVLSIGSVQDTESSLYRLREPS